MAIVAGLIAVGWWHFDRPITGLAMATCYLILPYTRIALVDSGQLLPSAFIVGAVVFHNRPAWAGVFLGLATGWMPACLGLIALWTGYYRGRGAWRFVACALGVAGVCGLLALTVPGLADWGRAVGARSLAAIGLLPGLEAPTSGSFWANDDTFRLPVLIAYISLVAVSAWPSNKNLGELISLTAALLVSTQFWCLAKGGTLVLLYLPMILMVMFRPTLIAKRQYLSETRSRSTRESLHPVR